jgi:hypothetical protein
MDCKKAENLILSFTDLTPSQRAVLEGHLKMCPLCAKEFDFYQNSLKLMKKVLSFDVPENYWQEYERSLSPRLSSVSPEKKWWKDGFESLVQFLKVPLLGPVPAFVFSIIILAFLFVGLYPTFVQDKSSRSFKNNLIIFEGELLSSNDNGRITIYTTGKR